MNDLILEYKRGKKELEAIREDCRCVDKAKHLNEMIADMDYAIRWMRNGKQPNFYSKAIESKSAYNRRLLLDMNLFPCLELETSRYVSDERKRAVMVILQSLTERQLTCFLLHTAHMRSIQEVADELGISKSTANEHIELAKKKISEIVKDIELPE